MQTLYQYRTYSIDSSEESSGECICLIVFSVCEDHKGSCAANHNLVCDASSSPELLGQ